MTLFSFMIIAPLPPRLVLRTGTGSGSGAGSSSENVGVADSGCGSGFEVRETAPDPKTVFRVFHHYSLKL